MQFCFLFLFTCVCFFLFLQSMCGKALLLRKAHGWWCADMFLSVIVVAASSARCLEATGSAATRPRRTAGGEAPLASSPREPPLSPPNSRRGPGAPNVLY